MKRLGSVKRHGKEGSERRQEEMLALRIKLTSPTAGSGQCPCPDPLGQRKKGGEEKGVGGGGGHRREGKGREGREGLGVRKRGHH
jgi:hypothetical protein